MFSFRFKLTVLKVREVLVTSPSLVAKLGNVAATELSLLFRWKAWTWAYDVEGLLQKSKLMRTKYIQMHAGNRY